MGESKEALDEFNEFIKFFMKEKKDPMNKFMSFMNFVLEDGALDTKTKELIALGMGLKSQCKYCINLHAKKALEAGANKDELLEVATIATLMGGGPSLSYATKLKQAIEEFGE